MGGGASRHLKSSERIISRVALESSTVEEKKANKPCIINMDISGTEKTQEESEIISVNNEEVYVPLMEHFENLSNACIEFFKTKEPAEIKTWATKSGCKISEQMSYVCLKYKNKRISIEKRLEITKQCLEKEIPKLFLRYLIYAIYDMRDIFIKVKNQFSTSKQLEHEQKQSEKVQTSLGEHNSSDIEIEDSDFEKLLNARKIICSILIHFLNCSDSDQKSVLVYIEIGILELILKILEIYHSVLEEYKEVCSQ